MKCHTNGKLYRFTVPEDCDYRYFCVSLKEYFLSAVETGA